MTNFKCDEDQALVFVDGVQQPILVAGTWDVADDTAQAMNAVIGAGKDGSFYSDRATDLVPDTRCWLDYPMVGYYVDGDALRTGRRTGYVVTDDGRKDTRNV